MKPTSPLFTGSNVCAQGIESVNTSVENVAVCEGFDNTATRYRAGLTAKQITRFWSKVQRGPGCWPWTASCFRNGYGQFNAGRFPNGKQDTRYAHRVAFELVKGPIPRGKVVRHAPVICDNPPCCRPSHLLCGTQAQNIADAQQQGKYEGERPWTWKLPPAVYHEVITLALVGPRGTIARLARQHGVSIQMLAAAVRRHQSRLTGAPGQPWRAQAS